MKKTFLPLSVIALLLALASPILADTVESGAVSRGPAEWKLPWASGTSAVVTWQPEDHWANGKASGLAFDFSLPEGTPLFAPAGGIATFKQDNRPLDTTLGNYVELTVNDEWIIRMAHLRDDQLGTISVEQGELIGYVGHSGVALTHLHLEILALRDGQLVCPVRSDIPTLMGLSLSVLTTDASITNQESGQGLYCTGVEWADAVVSLGQFVPARLVIANASAMNNHISKVRITLVSPDGNTHETSLYCDQHIAGNSTACIPITLLPDKAGLWMISDITATTDLGAVHMPVSEGFSAGPAPLTFVGISGLNSCALGEDLTAQVWLSNPTDETLSPENIRVEGFSPEGIAWNADSDENITLKPGQILPITVTIQSIVRTAGDWTISKVAFINEGNTFTLAQIQQELHVAGPQVRIQQVSVCPSPQGAKVFLLVQNTGDDQVAPSRLHLWALDADGTSYFPVSSEPVGLMQPGQQRLVEAEIWEGEEGLTLVQAGYWSEGAFWPISLPASLARNTHWNADTTL